MLSAGGRLSLTLFQNDRRSFAVVCEAPPGEPLEAIVTTADVDSSGLEPLVSRTSG
jgi:hypothetical protein